MVKDEYLADTGLSQSLNQVGKKTNQDPERKVETLVASQEK